MRDFPSNSQRVREGSEGPSQEPRRVEQVTSAEAERRKVGLGRKFKGAFINGTARGAGEYMIAEVIVPAIRDTMIDALQGGIERFFNGEGRIRRTGHTSGYPGQGPQVNYSAMSMGKPPTSRTLSQQSRARHDFGEIVIHNRAEAEEVLDRMYEELSRYGQVTVAVLYELTGIAGSHTDHKWGWTSLRGAKLDRVRSGGYLLNLPEPQPLGR